MHALLLLHERNKKPGSKAGLFLSYKFS